jgi:CRP-like cAMP-binding protein
LQRLAERLLDLSRSPYYPDGEHRPILGLSQELLASAVLCTRQTTNELLRQLQSRGLIKSEYGRIDILDAEGLRKIFQPR